MVFERFDSIKKIIQVVYTKNFTFMHVYLDSKVIIDWVNGRGRLSVSMLHSCKMKVKDFIPSFSQLEFHHIYREFNVEEDNLSK